MFFQKRRLEEELERIRKANLPSERNDEGETDDFETTDAADTEGLAELEDSRSEMVEDSTKPAVSDDLRLTTKDIIAMIIAAFSIVIPYALLFIGIAVLFVYLFFAR